MIDTSRKLFIIPQKNKKIFLPKNPFVMAIAGLSIFSMIIPVIVVDLSVNLYQACYFSIMRIPKVKRSDYIVFDRQKLSSLTRMQKLGCIYCSYTNGVLAWAKEVANQTEIYSCAIKHLTSKEGQEHHTDFYEFNEL